MKNKYLRTLALLSAASIIVVLFIMSHAYIEAVDVTKKQFSDQQLMLARQTGLGIEQNMQILVKELAFLSDQQAIKDLDIDKSKGMLEDMFKHVKLHSVNDIALMDSEGIVKFTLNAPHLKDKDFSFREYYQTAKILQTKSPTYEHIEFKGADIGQKGIMIAMPVFSPEDHFNGMVLFTVKVNALIRKLISQETSNSRLWIIDNTGNILYHPEYSSGTSIADMLGGSKSFRSFIDTIQAGKQHQVEYVLPDGVVTLAASYPVMVAGQAWSVVVSAPEGVFREIMAHSSIEYALGILLIVLVATGAVATLLSYNTALKKAHDGLEVRVKERTADLNAAKTNAEEEQAKTEGILAAIGDPVTIIDTDFNITYQNDNSRELTGGDARGEKCYKAFQGRDALCEDCLLEKTFKDGGIYKIERQVAVDGEVRHFEVISSPIHDPEGNIIAGVDTARDITERKQAEEAIKENEERYRILFNSGNDAVFVHGISDTGLPGKFIEVNDLACQMYGYTKEEFMDMSPADINDPEKAADPAPVVEKLRTDKHVTFETVDMTKDGKSIPVEISSQFFMFKDEPVILSIVRDITKRKRAEDALKAAKIAAEEERAKTETIIACMGDAISIQDRNFKVLYQNQICKNMIGDHAGKYCYEAYEGSDHVCEGCPLDMAFEDGEIHTSERSTTTDKGMSHIDITASPLRNSSGDIVGGIELMRDITTRKQNEEALQKAEEELRTTYNAISGHLTVVDTDYRIVSYNKSVERQFGTDLTGRLCYEAYQARDEICPGCAVKKTIETKKPAFTFQPATPVSNPVEIYTSPIFDDKGEIAAVVEHGIEVTEKVKMQEALRESEHFLAEAQKVARIGSWEWNIINNKITWSDELYRIFGLDPQEFDATYETFLSFIHPDDRKAVDRTIKEAVRWKKPHNIDHRIVRPDGDVVFINSRGEATYDDSGKPVIMRGTGQDITEKARLEREALRSAQLASIGELAAGVAHEINNPINGIINYAQILLNRSKKKDNRDMAERIIIEGDRIALIVSSLLSFARSDSEIKTPIAISDLFSEVLALTSSQLLKKGIDLKADIPGELPKVQANRQQMEQVFLNIINNARHALDQKYPGGGKNKTLTIAGVEVAMGGIPHVRITFTDTGIGIPPGEIKKVTDAFFTTKTKGTGTGLGLSISQSIVNDHGGDLFVESAEGEFTRVTIALPAFDAEAEMKNREKQHEVSS
jgi:PAS domain S-box-containing protein